jgi:FkbM family methyltransferase
MNRLKKLLRAALRRCGYDVTSYSHFRSHELRRAKLLRDRQVTLVLDGGANRGQFAAELRALGYHRRIVSVEPQSGTFADLRSRWASDPNWLGLNVALGEGEGEDWLYVSEITEVSSLLRATGRWGTEGWTGTHRERVTKRTIDSILTEVAREGDAVYLKLDLQGYEYQALQGAAAAIGHCVAIELEMSSVDLYEGAARLSEIFSLMESAGLVLYSVEPVLVHHATGHVLQTNAIFLRRQLVTL